MLTDFCSSVGQDEIIGLSKETPGFPTDLDGKESA